MKGDIIGCKEYHVIHWRIVDDSRFHAKQVVIVIADWNCPDNSWMLVMFTEK